MSRSSAKERGRVRTDGRAANTLRVVENFGSWKHNFFSRHDGRKITPLSRRFIGGENRGHKLELDTRLIELRKPTKRMVAKFEEDLWSGPKVLVAIRTRSNYHNPKRLRRMAKELATAEVSSYLEERREMLEAERQEAESDGLEDPGGILLSSLGPRKLRAEDWGFHHFF